MTALVSQALASGQPAPGFPQRDVSPGILGLSNRGLQPASFTAQRNSSYTAPTGGTITLPTPTGSNAFIAISVYGTTVTFLSGTISAGGATLTSFPLAGDQTLIICDADATRGWV